MPIVIVDPQEILQPAQVQAEQWNLLRLIPEVTGDLEVLRFLAKRGLIKNSRRCGRERCAERVCTLQKHAKAPDGYRWKCGGCGTTITMRRNSFFFNSKLKLKALVLLMYWWAADQPQNYIQDELDFSRKTSIDWHNFLRDVCAEDLNLHPFQLGGRDPNGERMVVEVDESLFFKRKYNRGALRPSHWVLGAIDRATRQVMMAEVPDRNADTLTGLLEQWIAPGSRVITDGWAAYRQLQNRMNDIQHEVVIHEDNFVDPVDRTIHTNNIEAVWSQCKRKFKRMYGTYPALFPSYLQEFMWRVRHPDNHFCQIMTNIREQYPMA